jgi:hypothetical protein
MMSDLTDTIARIIDPAAFMPSARKWSGENVTQEVARKKARAVLEAVEADRARRIAEIDRIFEEAQAMQPEKE